MSRGARIRGLPAVAAAAAAALLLALLVLPLAALLLSSSPAELWAGAAHPHFAPALALSLRTSAMALALTLLAGTPLAWWLARSRSGWGRAVELAVELPVVIPPAVVGVALLQTFGRGGLLGPALAALGLALPFSERAVVLAQLVVAAPLYVLAAANAFRRVEPDALLVARTLGASPTAAVLRVAVPIALPGLLVGASLAWARALGEFGATLLFAGNLVGETQTLPLAIFAALESDVRLAVVFAVALAALAGLLLLGLRLLPGRAAAWWAR